MRETPSNNLVSIKRNFFKPGETRVDLGSGVQAAKGVYASIRPALVAPGKAAQGGRTYWYIHWCIHASIGLPACHGTPFQDSS